MENKTEPTNIREEERETWRAVRSVPSEGVDGWWLMSGERNIGWINGGANNAHIAAMAESAPDLFEALANLIPRFERACKAAGSDDEFIAEATKDHRAALSKARGSDT